MIVDNFEVEVLEHGDDRPYREFGTLVSRYRRCSMPWTSGCYIGTAPNTRFDVVWRFRGGRPSSWVADPVWSASSYSITVEIDGQTATSSTFHTPWGSSLRKTNRCVLPQHQSDWYARMLFGSHDAETLPKLEKKEYASKIPETGDGSLVVTFTPYTSVGKPSKGCCVLKFVFLYRDFESLDRWGLVPPISAPVQHDVGDEENETDINGDAGDNEEADVDGDEEEGEGENEADMDGDEGDNEEAGLDRDEVGGGDEQMEGALERQEALGLQLVSYVKGRSAEGAQQGRRTSNGYHDDMKSQGSIGDDQSFRKALTDRLERLDADRLAMKEERETLESLLDEIADTSIYLHDGDVTNGDDGSFEISLKARIKQLTRTRKQMLQQRDKIISLRDETTKPGGKENSGPKKRKTSAGETAAGPSKRQKA